MASWLPAHLLLLMKAPEPVQAAPKVMPNLFTVKLKLFWV